MVRPESHHSRCYSRLGGKTTATILIRGARQLLTLHGPPSPRRGPALNDPGIIQDGSLLIQDGIIKEVGSTRRIENLAQARNAVEINAAGRVVMPGFVDSHTHLGFPQGPSGDDESALRAVRAASRYRLRARAHGYLEAMARHGTTTVEAKTGCGPDESAVIKLLRVLTELKGDPLDVIPTLLLRLPEYGCGGSGPEERPPTALLTKIRRLRLARFVDIVWDGSPVHEECVHQYLETTRALGFASRIHADHAAPGAAIDVAVRHFVLSIDHLEHASPGEAMLLGGSSTMATLLPGASFRDDSRNAPARALIDAGVAVALGTDFNPSRTAGLSMQTAIALACRRLGMSAAEAVVAATINGAHALSCADRVGSLEVGKSADLVILNVPDYRELAYQFGTNLVRMTMVRGQFIYREGEVLGGLPKVPAGVLLAYSQPGGCRSLSNELT